MLDVNYLVQDSWLKEILDQCLNLTYKFKHDYICTDHVLVTLIARNEFINEQLFSKFDNPQIDIELQRIERIQLEPGFEIISHFNNRLFKSKDARLINPATSLNKPINYLKISKKLALCLQLAKKYSLYLGQTSISAEHLLMAFLQISPSCSLKILEEIGTNLNYVQQSLMQSLATELSLNQNLLNLHEQMVEGLQFIFDWYKKALGSIDDLELAKPNKSTKHVSTEELAHKVIIKYLPDFLFMQITIRRYLLENSLKAIEREIGSVSQQFQSQLVVIGAQNLRSHVKQVIEHLFSHECHLWHDMPTDAEYELIGSIVEELWWSQGEALALDDLFEMALQDHRRKHLLDLQKNKIETTDKLKRVKTKLESSINQILKKHTVKTA